MVSEKTGKWRDLDFYDLPFEIIGKGASTEFWEQYNALFKRMWPAWYSSDMLDEAKPKRGTYFADAWVRTHETIVEAFDDPEVRAAVHAALDMSADTFAKDPFLVELAEFCAGVMVDPRVKENRK